MRAVPADAAIANFQCALSLYRLRKTSDEELRFAMSRLPRQTCSSLSTVYVIGNEANDLLKIGYADNLKSRFSGLNCGSPVSLRLVHFIHVVDGVIAKLIEGEAHRRLAEYRRKGEWFEVSADQAGEAIADAAICNRVRWWTEEESRRLVQFTRNAYVRHEERARLFGT